MHSSNRVDDERKAINGRETRITTAEPTIGDLVKQLGHDLETLVRQEVALGKAEIGQIGRRLAKDGTSVGVAAAFGIVGLLTVTAGLVILLGRALGGRYWLSALILGGLALVWAFVLLSRVRADLETNPLVPRETLTTIREDGRWVAREAHELKENLKTNPARRVTWP